MRISFLYLLYTPVHIRAVHYTPKLWLNT